MKEPLADLVPHVVDHTANREMESEDWEKAVAINGLVATEEDRALDAAQRFVDRSIATQTSDGQFSYGSLDYKPWLGNTELDSLKGISDPAAIGYSVLEFYERTGDEKYLDAATRQYEFLQEVDRTEDGGISHRRADIELWVDSIYMLCPFLARYGQLTDNRDAIDDAARQIKLITDRLQDSHTGLCRHIWSETPNTFVQPTFWARGNGWATAGILDTLELLPDDHPDREIVADRFRDIADTVVELQDESGFWHHILDDPETPLETSGTLMNVYSFLKGVEMGLLDEQPYTEAARRGMEVTLDLVNEDGGVTRVAKPPGGPQMPFGVTSFGQGWFLLAADKLL